ncbi:MAG: DNA replication complex GINS family protein [Thermoplasmata archaeon]|nr:MAG: DNA replication complex GINS family protein [Thermoplasmata archaeon]
MAPGEEMGFKFIQQVQQRESRSHNLTKLPADFFENLALHIAGLRQLARDEMARDPMSTTATLVSNELRNTLSLSQDIILLRLRKMANRAVDSLEGGKVDVRALTPREKDLYGELASFMATAHGELTPPKGTGTAMAPPTPTPAPTPADETVMEATEGPKEAPEGEETASVEAAPEVDVQVPTPSGEDAVLIHVLKDTPPFAGDDGQTYSLKKGDMVSIPGNLAQVLVSRGMAEEVPGTL